ncbi:thymidylate kinase-domain-containing protein [Xylariaceae sp. FL0016]|nr:thymidylate kinase-domain-containing protein [Xylariaceae sp. FL0016]
MASINDLATAATIASSAVALQTSPGQQRSNSNNDSDVRDSASPLQTAAAAEHAKEGLQEEAESAGAVSTDQRSMKREEDSEDGGNINVATSSPPREASPAPVAESTSTPPPPPPPPATTTEEATSAAVPHPNPADPSPKSVSAPAPAPAPVLAAPHISPPHPAQAQIPAPAASSSSAAAGEDAMDGVEMERDRSGRNSSKELRKPPVRGAFIVFEGMDRAGKTTQAKLLQQRCVESGRETRFMRFPDRTTPIGQMIDSYLKGESEIEDHVIHLLFSANRWEAVKKIKASLEAGHTIICDRFYHSGIVYSAAKQLPSLSLSWAKAPEVGLPRPDMVLFLDLEESVARARGGWGGEVYEKGEMQRRVRDLFWGLSMGDLGGSRNSRRNTAANLEKDGAPVGGNGTGERDRERSGGSREHGGGAGGEAGEFRQEEEDIQIQDADMDVESLSDKVWEVVVPRLEAVERGEVGRSVRIVR